jgi:hypothetical protein
VALLRHTDLGRRACPNRSSGCSVLGTVVWRSRRLAMAPMAVVAVLCSCSSAPAVTPKPSVPAGWTTHTFDGVTISTPPTWKIFRQPPVCPGSARVGALLLGAIHGAACPPPPGMHHPPHLVAPNVVNITNFSGTSSLPEGCLRSAAPRRRTVELGLRITQGSPRDGSPTRTAERRSRFPRTGAWSTTRTAPSTKISLLLGYGKTLEYCANYPSTLNVVVLYRQPLEIKIPAGRRITVNGVPVIVTRSSANPTVWYAPSLDLYISARGPSTARVLHTLRRA